MRVLAITVANLRRLVRDRSNIFFVFILPLAIIVLVGAQFGGGGASIRLAVSAGEGPLTDRVIELLEAESRVAVVRQESEADLRFEVERGAVSAGVAIPVDFDESIRAGESPEVGFVVRPDQGGSVGPILAPVLAEATANVRVARAVAEQAGIDIEQALAVVEPIAVERVGVTSQTVGESLFPPGLGQFTVGAAQQLVLFVFLTVLTGSAAIIQSRQLGVSRRMLSTPTSPTTIVVGEAAGKMAIGVLQGLYIVVVTLVVFGVNWGDLVGVAAIVVALSAVSAGAAMLLGTVFRNDQQAGGISVLLGLGMAALGGCMLPLELFSPSMNRIAHFTPHAWAIDAFAELVYLGGGLVDVLPELAVLAGFAVVLLGLAGWRLRQVITTG